MQLPWLLLPPSLLTGEDCRQTLLGGGEAWTGPEKRLLLPPSMLNRILIREREKELNTMMPPDYRTQSIK